MLSQDSLNFQGVGFGYISVVLGVIKIPRSCNIVIYSNHSIYNITSYDCSTVCAVFVPGTGIDSYKARPCNSLLLLPNCRTALNRY